MTTKSRYRVLFLCTGNSARSIIAEHLLRAHASDRFEAFSAGSHPKGEVHPLALAVLNEHQIDTSQARSKSWQEFEHERFDFIITVCDRARETCPVFPGRPVNAHWGSPDPAGVTGDEATRRRAFADVANQIAGRIHLFCSLREDQLDHWHVQGIGGPSGTPGASA